MPTLAEQMIPRRKLLLMGSETVLITAILFFGAALPWFAMRPFTILPEGSTDPAAGVTVKELLEGLLTSFTIAIICQTSLSYNDLYDWRTAQNRAELPNRLLHACGYALVMLAVLVLLAPRLFYFPTINVDGENGSTSDPVSVITIEGASATNASTSETVTFPEVTIELNGETIAESDPEDPISEVIVEGGQTDLTINVEGDATINVDEENATAAAASATSDANGDTISIITIDNNTEQPETDETAEDKVDAQEANEPVAGASISTEDGAITVTVTGGENGTSLVDAVGNAIANAVGSDAGVSLTCLVFGNCDETKPANNVDKIDTSNVTDTAEEDAAATTDAPEILDDDEDDDDTEVVAVPAGSCLLGDTVYNNFADVPSDDPCKVCYCNSGEIICASQECQPPRGYEDCTPMAAPEGKCCPEQYECGKDETSVVFKKTC